jgi:hypothetical protein
MKRSCCGLLLLCGVVSLTGLARAQPEPRALPSEVEPKALVIKAAVGQIVKLSPATEANDDAEKLAILWQLPPGLSSKADSNMRDVYVASATAGTFRVVAIVAKNGTPRPTVWLFETTLEVGQGAAPAAPKGPVINAAPVAPALPKSFEALAGKLKAEAADATATAKTSIGKAYVAVAKYLEATPNATAEDELRKLNECLQPLQAADAQKLLGQIATVVNAERPALGNYQSKHLYRAIASGLGVVE